MNNDVLKPRVVDSEERARLKRDREWEREDAKREREEAKANKPDLAAIYHKATEIVGNSFPDGDPTDTVINAL